MFVAVDSGGRGAWYAAPLDSHAYPVTDKKINASRAAPPATASETRKPRSLIRPPELQKFLVAAKRASSYRSLSRCVQLVTLCAPAHERFRAARPARARRYASGGRRPGPPRICRILCGYDRHQGFTGMTGWALTGPIRYTGHAAIQRDIANFKAAANVAKAKALFMAAVAPASVAPDRIDEYYRSDEEYVFAVADALHDEYKAIIDAGLILQVDDAYLALTYEVMVPPKKLSDYRKWAAVRIEALNHALRGLPEERTRYHVCWGSWNGPHAYDVELKNIVDLILKVRVGGYLLEMANPRHEHEWRVWESVKLPTGRMLVPGVISHATNVVEHPALVAERLTRLAKLVGRDNLMAGTDCGFAQGPFVQRVHPSIMWAKLRSLVEGARLASKQLWSRRAIV